MADSADSNEFHRKSDGHYELDFEGLAKAGGFMVAAAYAVGLLASNVYLANLGITDFSLLKFKAIFTGALVLGSLVLVASPAMQVGFNVTYRSKIAHPNLTSRMSEILWVLSPFVLTTIATSIVSEQPFALGEKLKFDYSIAYWSDWVGWALKPALNLFSSATAMAIFFVAAARFYTKATSKPSIEGKGYAWSQFIVAATAVIFCIAWYTSAFAGRFYDAIPQQFGGGKAKYVLLSTDDTAKMQLRRMGLRFFCNPVNPQLKTGSNDASDTGLSETEISDSVGLLYETDDFLVVRILRYDLENKSAKEGDVAPILYLNLRIDKKLIKGIILTSNFSGDLIAKMACHDYAKDVQPSKTK
jgi:hypothetical protein